MARGIIRGTDRPDGLSARWDGDRVLGRGGDDRLTSLFNDSVLIGGRGADRLFTEIPSVEMFEDPPRVAEQRGGDGNDRLLVRRSYDDAPTWPGGAPTTYTHRLHGDDGDDRITLESSSMSGFDSSDNIVSGGTGNDVIRVLLNAPGLPSDIWGVGVTTEIDGGEGDDSIRFVGVSGGDPFGGVIATTLDGGAGSDSIWASSRLGGGGDGEAEMDVNAGAGDDHVVSIFEAGYGGGYEMPINGLHQVTGGAGDDALTATTKFHQDAGELATRILAGRGDDTVTLSLDVWGMPEGTVETIVDGGSGDDRLQVAMAPSTHVDIRGGGGADTLVLIEAEADDSYVGGSADLVGGTGADRLSVTGGIATRLDGGAGADTLSGGAGADAILGGSGDDELAGGDGSDRFMFDGSSGKDRVLDFEAATDILVFDDGVDFEAVAVVDFGAGNDVAVELGRNTITFVGAGTGSATSLDDLVDAPDRQIVIEALI